MTATLEAVYESGVFRPLAQMNLAEGKHVQLIINAEESVTSSPEGPDPRKLTEIMAGIAALSVIHGEPDSGGRDHDLILYGGPEGAR